MRSAGPRARSPRGRVSCRSTLPRWGASSRARRRTSTPTGTTSRARPRRWPTTCSCSTRSTSDRAGFRPCESGRGCRGTSPWRPRCPISGAGPRGGRSTNYGHCPGTRRALDLVAEAGGSAERLASMLAAGMPFYDDAGFWKRAQIVPNDLALAGVARFDDLDRLTIFADNLVPHVLRVDGVLRYDPSLEARIDVGELIPPGREEREIRGCAVHACELLSERLGMPPRVIDTALWTRGQAPRYKAVPRHRTRTVFY